MGSTSDLVQRVFEANPAALAAYAALVISLFNSYVQRRDKGRERKLEERRQAELVSAWLEVDEGHATLHVQNNSDQPVYDVIVVPRNYYFNSQDKTGMDDHEPFRLPVVPPRTTRQVSYELARPDVELQDRPHLSFRDGRDACWLRDMHGRLWPYERDRAWMPSAEGMSFWDVFVDRVPRWLKWLGPKPVPGALADQLYALEQFRRDRDYQRVTGLSRSDREL